MAVEESLSLSKALVKIEKYLVRVIPMLFALATLLNTFLSYWDIDLPIISYFASVSFLTLIFMYASSIAFRFCLYHRMFIHYTALNWILNVYDLYIGIPLDNRELFMLYVIIAGIFLFIIVKLKLKCNKMV